MKYLITSYIEGFVNTSYYVKSNLIKLHDLGLYNSVKTRICLAFDGASNVGGFQFEVSPQGIVAWGTYVLPSYRGKNIARQMWVKALKHFEPKSVHVCTISKSGENLINSLSKKYNQYNWNHI